STPLVRERSAVRSCPWAPRLLAAIRAAVFFSRPPYADALSGRRDAKVSIQRMPEGNSMSIEADFTPPGVPAQAAQDSREATFPLSTSLNIAFSAYEDRLVLRSRRVNREPVNVLMTRRMTIIVL